MNYDSATVRQKAWQWLDRFFRESGPATDSNALSWGILSLHALGKLDATLENQFAGFLRERQDPVSGYFLAGRRDDHGLEQHRMDDPHATQRATFFALLALRVLDAKPSYPLKFLADCRAEGVPSWVDDLRQSKRPHKGERIAHRLLFDICRRETEGNQDAAVSFHRILDLLEGAKAAKNGLWEIGEEADSDGPITTAGCILPFFEYVRRPILSRSRMVDAMIHVYESGRMPSAALPDLALVSALAAVKYQLHYRDDEIKTLFMRLRDSICRSQERDGSFRDSTPMAKSDGEGMWVADVEATFLRLSTLAIIERTLPEEFPGALWQTPEWPGPGYHHPLDSLTEHERKVLPSWLRPTAFKGSATEGDTRKPALSVVIPCYNLGRYLHEAVESVLQQSYQEFEIIIVDDGSTDDFTCWLLQNFDRPKTRVFRQENAGLAATRNRGILKASGDYICCLDPDDCLRPEFFAQAVGVLEREPDVGLVSGFFQMFDERNDTFRYGACEFPDLLAYNQAIEPAIFRRDLWDKTGGYCETFTTSGIEDWDLWISFIELGYRAHVIPEVVWEYRIRSDQMSTEMYEPDRWGRLFGELVQRHSPSYANHASPVLAKQAARWAELRLWANECQRAAGWWESQAENWRRRAEERDRALENHQRDKAWLKEQQRTWQETAEERARTIAEQRRWIGELEKGKAWFEEQSIHWKGTAEERAKTIAEQQGWIGELEKAKAWFESQSANWQRLAEERERAIAKKK